MIGSAVSNLGGRLGLCRVGSCDRMYMDASRTAVRRFCSFACRSRIKVAAFRRRRHE
ncbi:CGNR zinc finger domain-containing protein [Nonomuraea sp. NPDC050536]|uniref:CGNR zinc finger domain-containing protein n=1 Tax=Nonomuraea sp. NPDC050536 TaxID=3364366 RepID=UPI0037C62277